MQLNAKEQLNDACSVNLILHGCSRWKFISLLYDKQTLEFLKIIFFSEIQSLLININISNTNFYTKKRITVILLQFQVKTI